MRYFLLFFIYLCVEQAIDFKGRCVCVTRRHRVDFETFRRNILSVLNVSSSIRNKSTRYINNVMIYTMMMMMKIYLFFSLKKVN